MAAQDGFAGGAQSGFQMGLSMFSVMQQKAYQDAVLQNADENQAMRQQELQLNQRKFIAEAQQKAMLEDQHVLEHPDAFPQAL